MSVTTDLPELVSECQVLGGLDGVVLGRVRGSWGRAWRPTTEYRVSPRGLLLPLRGRRTSDGNDFCLIFFRMFLFKATGGDIPDDVMGGTYDELVSYVCGLLDHLT